MDLITEIFHASNLALEGKKLYREAVRAIIKKDTELLLIYSKKIGDYKFPGGGVEPGETYLEALKREVREECGALVKKVTSHYGKIVEYNTPLESEYDIFQMVSYYYICDIEEVHCETNLDPYEERLGFKPVWVSAEIAAANNRSIMNSKDRKTFSNEHDLSIYNKLL